MSLNELNYTKTVKEISKGYDALVLEYKELVKEMELRDLRWIDQAKKTDRLFMISMGMYIASFIVLLFILAGR